jgi:minimal PKS chain-length factor (CLF/KS beta)
MTSRTPDGSPAVITGLGVVAPNGIGSDAYWKSVREGIGVLDAITREGFDDLPLRVAGEIRGFDAPAVVESRYVVQTDRFTHFALAAADLALADAGLHGGPDSAGNVATVDGTSGSPDTPAAPSGGPTDPAGADATDQADAAYRIGVVTAAGSGGGEFGQRELQRLWSRGPRHVGPYQSIAWFYAASTGQISIRGGFKGPCGVVASDEAGGLDAVAHARRQVRHGTPTVLCGAAEAPLAPYSAVCQLGYRELSLVAEPEAAYLPFTSRAAGFAPAEGGGMLVVEDAERARRRGAPARAVIAGHAATFTGAGRWAESREALAYAVTAALADAGLPPEAVGAVFADALGTPEADRAEAAALADALGPHAARVPVTAPKSGLGRAYCGAPVLDVAAAVLALDHGLVPPTPYVAADDVDGGLGLDLVTGRSRPVPGLGAVLVLSRGLAGSASALVLTAPGTTHS